MRLLCAIGLVLSMSSTDIERAQTLGRARDSERQQFHHRYIIDLPGSTIMAADDPEERVTIFMVWVGKWSDGTPAPPIVH